MSQFIVTIPDTASIPSFLDSLAESDEYSEFIDNHRGVLIGFLDQVFDQLAFSGQEILPSEESQQCPEIDAVDAELAQLSNKDMTTFPRCPRPVFWGHLVTGPTTQDDHFDSVAMVEQYRTQYGNIVADAYDTERALERIES